MVTSDHFSLYTSPPAVFCPTGAWNAAHVALTPPGLIDFNTFSMAVTPIAGRAALVLIRPPRVYIATPCIS